MLKVIKTLTIILLAQQTIAFGQDTIRRVPVKMSAREIAVDYEKAFRESSPVEAKAPVVHIAKRKASPSISKKAAPVVAAAKKPAVPSISSNPKIASVVKAAKTAPAVKKPALVEKPAIAMVKPKAQKPVKTSSTPVYVAEDGTKPIDSPEFKKFQKSIESEQAQWDSLANAQLAASNGQYPEDGSAESRMMYLYIGAAVTLAGIVFGLFFGRPAFLLSVVGVVFVVIGLFIQP